MTSNFILTNALQRDDEIEPADDEMENNDEDLNQSPSLNL